MRVLYARREIVLRDLAALDASPYERPTRAARQVPVPARSDDLYAHYQARFLNADGDPGETAKVCMAAETDCRDALGRDESDIVRRVVFNGWAGFRAEEVAFIEGIALARVRQERRLYEIDPDTGEDDSSLSDQQRGVLYSWHEGIKSYRKLADIHGLSKSAVERLLNP